MKDLSIIVPAHNEEENISQTIKGIEEEVKIGHELIIINDHSTDKTVAIVSNLMSQYPNLRLIENTLDGSFANAIKVGLANIKTNLVVLIMGDLCDDLKTIPVMIKKINDGYDVVCGSRYINGGKRVGGSKVKAFFSSCAGWSVFYLLGIPTHDVTNAFKMYKKRVISNMNIDAKGFEISMEIPLKAYYAGFKITEVPTTWKEREKGRSSFKMLRIIPDYLSLYFWGLKKRITG